VNQPEAEAIRGAIVLLSGNLMASIAITNTARALGFTVDRVQETSQLMERLSSAEGRFALAIIDMNQSSDWQRIASYLHSGASLPTVIGFGPHVDVEGRRAAKLAGLTRIVTNGQFHREMASLIERYAEPPSSGTLDSV
jgi:hypothetical protein